MTRNIATEALYNLIKKISVFVIPPSIIAGVVEYFFENKIYSIVSVLATLFVLYILWIELRLREIEKRIQ